MMHEGKKFLETAYSHEYMGSVVNDNMIKDMLKGQKIITDWLIELLEPTEIVINVIDTIQDNPDTFGGSARVITHLLLPTLYKDFKKISKCDETHTKGIECLNGLDEIKMNALASDVQDAIEYIKLASQTWYDGKLSLGNGCITKDSYLSKLPDNSGRWNNKQLDDNLRYINDNIALVLASFLNNVSSRSILPLALNLCSAFLLATHRRYIDSLCTSEANNDLKPNIKGISYHYCLWINSLSKYAPKDIENVDVLRSLLILCQSYYLIFSINMVMGRSENEGQGNQALPLGDNEIVEVLSLTIKWVIAAFKKGDKSIMWSAINILQNITILDSITDMFFNSLESDTVAELVILMLMKIGDHSTQTIDTCNDDSDKLMCTLISKILKKVYILSKDPFIREVMDASVRVYKIDKIIGSPFTCEHNFAPRCSTGN